MMNNPEIQKRAQLEIDKVVGFDRLPNFNDLPALPYVGALIRELKRWYPVAPLGKWGSQNSRDYQE